MHVANGPAALRHVSVERQRHITLLIEFDVLLQPQKREGLRVGGVTDSGSEEEEERGEFHSKGERSISVRIACRFMCRRHERA